MKTNGNMFCFILFCDLQNLQVALLQRALIAMQRKSSITLQSAASESMRNRVGRSGHKLQVAAACVASASLLVFCISSHLISTR